MGVHRTGELSDFITQNQQWLRVYQLPSYAPDLNPTEGVWSLLTRSLANLAAANLDHLVRVLKRTPEEDPVPARRARRLPG